MSPSVGGATRSPLGFDSVEVGQRRILYQEGSRRLHVLNATGSLVWQRLAAGETVQGIAEELAQRFRIPLDQAGRDCRLLVNRFWKELPPEPASGRPVRVPAARQATVHVAAGRALDHPYQIAGRNFTIRTTPSLGTRIDSIFGHLRSDRGSPVPDFIAEVVPLQDGFAVNSGGAELGRPRTAGQLIQALLWQIARSVFAEPDWLAILHAGAVAHGDRCLVFPAPGGSGKTTLVAALVNRGWSFLGDDVLAMDRDDLGIVALPFPLSVKQGSWPVVGAWFPQLMDSPVAETGEKRVRYMAPPVPGDRAWNRGHVPACLISPRYSAGAGCRLEAMEPGESLEMLFDANSSISGGVSATRIRQLVRWVSEIPSYRLEYGDLSAALETVEQLATP